MKLATAFRTAAAFLALAGAVTAPALAQVDTARATYPYRQSQPIPGRYIVRLQPNVANPAAASAALVREHGGQLRHSYTAAIKGFAATLPDAAVNALRNNPNVLSVEQDATVSVQQLSSPQNQVTWGLDRIDQADRPLDTQYHFTRTGADVNAFIVDTGIRADHVEFSGRVLTGVTFVPDANGTNDCNGHGTHVAGTVGGTTWGVAKGVSLIPVRVLDCAGSGSWSGVIAGIDWVANSTLRPAVANLSLGGTASATVDAAVAGAVTKGVTVVVAAGNSNDFNCVYSPAREPTAITVAATNADDARASYSNYGTCVDLFAPGSGITSAGIASSTASKILSGTSMAAPHVSGVAALALEGNPTATPAAIASHIISTATANRLLAGSIGSSPNLLVYAAGSGGAVAPAPAPLTVAYKSMLGSATKSGGNWRASATVTVRDVNSGAGVSNATVSGSFSPGGATTCVTASDGSCTLTSSALKYNAAPSTTLTGTGVSGTQLNYDPSQNTVSQIVISKP